MSDFEVKSYFGDYPFFGEKLLFPIVIDGVFYTEKDAHIFIANGNELEDGLPCQGLPTFVAVNGVDVTPTSLTTRTVERKKIGVDGVTTTTEEVQTTAIDFNDGDIIHAIFDWHNTQWGYNNWYSDILQIGSRSKGGEPEGYVNPTPLPSGRIPNQLKSAFYAFYGMTYANSAAIANLDISNLTSMESMFTGAEAFNHDISHWDTSKVTNMEWMFCYTNFDQDISGWNVSKVTNMDNMFYAAFKFNQDLSQWCVSQFDEMPYYFDQYADDWTEPRPQWGSCPRGENLVQWPIKIDGVTYKEADAHIFIANNISVNLPIPNGTAPIFVAVDGVEKDYETEVKGNAFDGSTIHAIFDWNNVDRVRQDWFSDILQFGYNSETKQRNQLKSGIYAFANLKANSAAISNLDVSNVEDMLGMFYFSSFNSDLSGWNVSNVTTMMRMFYQATSFNQDISSWDTSSVADMMAMFDSASSFDQDLSKWCVSLIGSIPDNFNSYSGFEGQTAKHPQWGTCPRHEDILPYGYSLEDCHIFIANNNPVNFAIPWYANIQFVAVDGEPKDYETEVKGKSFNGSTIYAIFDWWNADNIKQNWFSDILQFGLNSETGKRNQLGGGHCAFYQMADGTNPAAIANLDVSNLEKMYAMFCQSHSFNQDISGWDVSNVKGMKQMFENTHDFNQDISGWDTSKVDNMSIMFFHAHDFDQDISGWDTSKVENMDEMFYKAYKFNQVLSQWCVSLIDTKPHRFDLYANAWTGGDATRPQWGTCPRGEA